MAVSSDVVCILASALFMIEDADESFEDFAVLAMAGSICDSAFGRPRNRIIGYFEYVVPRYVSEEFRRLFRMSRETCEIVSQYLENCEEMLCSVEGGREQIPVHKQLLVLLWYMAGSDSITKIADRFGISESSVILCRSRTMNAIINNLMPKFISWPQDQDACIIKFEQRNGFPGILGALDGTHKAQSYINRKKFHSIQLQAVCDTNMLFTDCFCGCPGSCHDSRVLSLSPLIQIGPVKCENNHIVANGGYPLKPWLITPFRDNGHLTRESFEDTRNMQITHFQNPINP